MYFDIEENYRLALMLSFFEYYHWVQLILNKPQNAQKPYKMLLP